MPPGMLRCDQTEVNYLAGYGASSLYLVLTNQSRDGLVARVRLDPNVVPYDAGRTYAVRTWVDNRPGAAGEMLDGEVSVPMSGQGITVLAIDGVKVQPRFQQEFFDGKVKPMSDASYDDAATPLGAVHSMLISMGTGRTSAYVWLEATEKELKEARLVYKAGGAAATAVDDRYPFEFGAPLRDDGGVFEFRVEGVKADGTEVRSADVVLRP
jgi:hypothetical protein